MPPADSYVSSVGQGSFLDRVLVVAFCLLQVSNVIAQSNQYPRPQIASAAGQISPDFTLKDQGGNNFRLASQRGHWVLLYFYRGYW